MSAPALRPYQLDAVAACRTAWAGGRRRILVQAATGTGKSVVAAHLIAERVERGERVLVVAHRGELLDQAAAHVARHVPPGTTLGRVQGSAAEVGAQVVVASAQTLWRPARRAALVASGGFRLVWVDEAHQFCTASNREMLVDLGCWADDGPDLLGVTATMDRLDGVDLGHLFEECVYSTDLATMIAAGYLAAPRARQVSCGIDLDRVRSVAGDYVAADLEAEMMRAEVPAAIVDAWRTFAAGRVRTLVFVPLVRIAVEVAEAFTAAGIAAEWVAGIDPPAERAAKLARHRNGETKVLVNALLLTLGYDDSQIDTIIWARPTQSRALFTQAIGRGLRPYPGKKECEIIDLVGSTGGHRLVGVTDLYPPGAQEAARLLLVQLLSPAGSRRRRDEVTRIGAATNIGRESLNLAARDLGVVTVVAGGERWVALPVPEPAEEACGTGPRDAPRLLSDGTIASVDIVEGRGRFAWQRVGRSWVLPGGLRLSPRRAGGWDVREGGAVVETAPDLGWAMGIAEDRCRATGQLVLADLGAPWRALPPTRAQLEVLARWGAAVPDTRGAAADAITAGRPPRLTPGG